MINLDFLCMKAAQEMVSGAGDAGAKVNVATSALGVLLENGPYGLVLHLETHREGAIAVCYRQHLLGLCREELLAAYLGGGAPASDEFGAVTDWLRGLAQDLDSYLFTKRLWQQALTYARYHAKALDDAPSPADTQEPGG